MSVGVRVQVDSDSRVLSTLTKLALDDDDKTALLDQIGISLVESVRLRFADQVDPDGKSWKPSLRVRMHGGQTLRDTGRLMASITHVVSGDIVECGTNVSYASLLHFGGDTILGGAAEKKKVTIPARPFLGVNEDDATLVLSLISNFMKV